jgi:hypothetical protein
MNNASQIKDHMDVKGSDGKHVGTVLGIENGRVKIASGGMDHEIDIAMVDAVKDGTSNRDCRRNRADLALA